MTPLVCILCNTKLLSLGSYLFILMILGGDSYRENPIKCNYEGASLVVSVTKT